MTSTRRTRNQNTQNLFEQIAAAVQDTNSRLARLECLVVDMHYNLLGASTVGPPLGTNPLEGISTSTSSNLNPHAECFAPSSDGARRLQSTDGVITVAADVTASCDVFEIVEDEEVSEEDDDACQGAGAGGALAPGHDVVDEFEDAGGHRAGDDDFSSNDNEDEGYCGHCGTCGLALPEHLEYPCAAAFAECATDEKAGRLMMHHEHCLVQGEGYLVCTMCVQAGWVPPISSSNEEQVAQHKKSQRKIKDAKETKTGNHREGGQGT